jgi:HD superfamily phosphohydrolase
MDELDVDNHFFYDVFQDKADEGELVTEEDIEAELKGESDPYTKDEKIQLLQAWITNVKDDEMQVKELKKVLEKIRSLPGGRRRKSSRKCKTRRRKVSKRKTKSRRN